MILWNCVYAELFFEYFNEIFYEQLRVSTQKEFYRTQLDVIELIIKIIQNFVSSGKC